ncbi:MAG: MoaD/ThiS family protein [SAR324 cluster bacterium]|nr:MoaD/ThiS family protein [SAR324 cluster bacterium]
MSIMIEIPSALTKYTNSQDEIQVEASTVGEAFEKLVSQYQDLKQHLYEENGNIRSFINVYLNDEDIRYADNLNTKAESGDSIQIVPSIAGGM